MFQVTIIVDNVQLEKLNSVNLTAATAAALLLLPSKFNEVWSFSVTQSFEVEKHNKYQLGLLYFQEELYAKICSLSYMGDLRMLFAEDKNKVNIIEAQVGNLEGLLSFILHASSLPTSAHVVVSNFMIG